MSKLKTPPPYYSVEDKRQFYITQMNALDDVNNKLRERIRRMSSDSHERKDNDFHTRRMTYVNQLEAGRILREAYRMRVRRLKETQKNINRKRNGSGQFMR